MTFLLAALVGCNGCRPQLPSDDDEQRQDTSKPPEDSGETGETGPVGPPPMCDIEEIEPNDGIDELQPIAMHSWACGHFDRAFDAEWLGFDATETGWMEVSVEAASRGSSADAQLDLINRETADSVHVQGRYLSSDPKLVFPLTEPGSFAAALGETQYLSGEDYAWYLRAAFVKAPVSYTFLEAEGNDSFDVSTPFQLGGTVFGAISAPDDFDWYRIDLDASMGQYTFNVVAYELGSPADLEIKLYDADGTTLLRTKRYGEIDYDPDPWMTQRSTVSATTWYLLVRTSDDNGSPYHWYTMSISFTPVEL